MNWNEIGAVGEAAGAIAVMVSVVYLAVQVRKQTRESRFAATRELAAQFQDKLKEVIDAACFESIDPAFREMLTFPGAQRWWALSRQHFVAEFRERVDAMLPDAATHGYRSSFKPPDAAQPAA